MQTLTSSMCMVGACLSLSLVVVSTTLAQPSSQLDREAIEQAAGTTATITEDGVVRIGWSRDDVAVTIDGIPFKPQAGLGSWAAFATMPNGNAMVMGDTVVFEDEITPAMDAAFEHGLQVTALHNHFVFDRPPVYFMHIGGMGDGANLRVYYVKDGRRVQLASADVEANPAQWHTIAIEHEGDEIACSFDGRQLLRVKDTTIGREGGVGVWTKADAASSFDDFTVEIEDSPR